jgi:DNA-binding SARP family transcriptional activator
MLKLYLLGLPRVEFDDTPVDIQRRKALALHQPHSRDTLATLFYPDQDQKRARAYLRRDLASLNTSLPGEWLAADREIVEFKGESEVQTVLSSKDCPNGWCASKT